MGAIIYDDVNLNDIENDNVTDQEVIDFNKKKNDFEKQSADKKAEELELIRCAQSGDSNAMEELTRRYHSFIQKRAFLFAQKTNINLYHDLEQEGWLAFRNAVLHYNSNAGSLAAYANASIYKQFYNFYDRESNNVRHPNTLRGKSEKLYENKKDNDQILESYSSGDKDTAENTIIRKILFNTIIDIMENLSEMEQFVFIERVNGMSKRNISRRTNLSLFKINKILNRASGYIQAELRRRGITYQDFVPYVA